MKKFFSLLAFLFLVGTSAAFAQATPEPTGYMMLIGNATFAGFTSKAYITTVTPDGQVSKEEVPANNWSMKQIAESLAALRQAELKKINELTRAGWVVAHVSTETAAPGVVLFQTTYMLEKRK